MASETRSIEPMSRDEVGQVRRRRWAWLVLMPPLCALLLVIVLGTSASSPGMEIRGVRLGMTPAQVRTRFDGGAPSVWRTDVGGADPVLVRMPGGAFDRAARFEFHAGMLVAIRLDLPEDGPYARGPSLQTSGAAILSRMPNSFGRMQVDLLARDCPSHAEEVSRRLAQER